MSKTENEANLMTRIPERDFYGGDFWENFIVGVNGGKGNWVY